MRKYTPQQREVQLQRQRAWHQKNRGISIEVDKTDYSQFKPKVKPSFYEILDVLRKDNQHYLWGYKSVSNWTNKDWFEFNKLKLS